MTGVYDLQLVALSLIVAIIASYTALELAGHVSQKQGKSSWAWLVGGAVSMGTGIWSMHFIGMLAFHLPVRLAYDASITMLSMGIAVLVSGLALFVVRRPILTSRNITAGAMLMGIGICAMHYTGMYAMRMSPPSCMMICFEIGKPRPVPPLARASLASTCTNFSNTRSL